MCSRYSVWNKVIDVMIWGKEWEKAEICMEGLCKVTKNLTRNLLPADCQLFNEYYCHVYE
jgi:hypothetical protein